MKRFISLLTCCVIALYLCACVQQGEAEQDDKIKVVCTIFPQYDFVREVGGDLVDLKLLVSAGADVHGYEPSLSDLKSVHECDLFIYCSGESESWVNDMLSSVGGVALDICSGIELILDDEEHDHDRESHYSDIQASHDEHVWTSPVNAIKIVEMITDELVKADEVNADEYKNNSSAYINELKSLDSRFREVFDWAESKTLIVADRFPFRYLTEEYGVEYYAAFSGCSSETEPTLSTLNELVKLVENEEASTVFYVEMSDQKTADVICKQTGCNKRLLHSCHNLTKEEFESGMTYLTLMKRNADIIEEALR